MTAAGLPTAAGSLLVDTLGVALLDVPDPVELVSGAAETVDDGGLDVTTLEVEDATFGVPRVVDDDGGLDVTTLEVEDATFGVPRVVDDDGGLDVTTLEVEDATFGALRVVVGEDTADVLVDKRAEMRAEPSPEEFGDLVEGAAIPEVVTEAGSDPDRDRRAPLRSLAPTDDDDDPFGPAVGVTVRAGWPVPGAPRPTKYSGSARSPAEAVSDAVSAGVAIGPGTSAAVSVGGGTSRSRSSTRGTAGTGAESLVCGPAPTVGR